MFRVLLVVSVALTGLACAEYSGRPTAFSAPGQQAEQVAKGPVQLVFLDSRVFDEDLSGSMRGASHKITVNVPAGFKLNDIPERIDRWLYSVKQGGGKVVAKPENPPRTRGLVAAVIDIVVSIAERVDEMRLYQPSQQYRATLLYREDGTVRKVVFDRR